MRSFPRCISALLRFARGRTWTIYEAGFQLLKIRSTETVEMAYLADFIPRFRAVKYTRYAGWRVGDLITTGARLIKVASPREMSLSFWIKRVANPAAL